MKNFLCILALASFLPAYSAGPDFSSLPNTKLTSPLKQIKPTGFGTWQNYKLYRPGVMNSWPRIAAIPYGQPDIHGITSAEKKQCGNKFPAHLGVDYSGLGESSKGKGNGTPVYAVADGVVAHVNGFTGYGDYHIIIVSGTSKDKYGKLTDPWSALYGHLSPKVLVQVNQSVKAGQQIGSLFNYVYDTDTPHLHFGIRKGNYTAGTSSMGFLCFNADGKTFDNKQFVNADLFGYITDYSF